MTRSKWDALWVPTFAVLVAFAVPWFLWGVDTVVAGLPVWIWWHVGWMGLCTVLFYRFTQGAWDRGMTFDAAAAEAAPSATAAGAAGASAEAGVGAEAAGDAGTDDGTDDAGAAGASGAEGTDDAAGSTTDEGGEQR